LKRFETTEKQKLKARTGNGAFWWYLKRIETAIRAIKYVSTKTRLNLFKNKIAISACLLHYSKRYVGTAEKLSTTMASLEASIETVFETIWNSTADNF